MTNFCTAVDSGVDAGPMKSAHCQLPGREMQSENEPESPSDSFNDALVPWIGRIQASFDLAGREMGDVANVRRLRTQYHTRSKENSRM